MAISTLDFNEQQYLNTNITTLTGSNYIDAPKTGRIPGFIEKFTPVYVVRTALNAITGQTESDTALVIN